MALKRTSTTSTTDGVMKPDCLHGQIAKLLFPSPKW